jgi:protein CpxP
VQFVFRAKQARRADRLSDATGNVIRPTDDNDETRQPQETNMKKFATAVAVTLLGAALAFAAPHEGGKGWGGHGRGGFERLAQQLNLTDAQKAQVEAIQKESREQNKAFFEQSRNTMKEFFAAKEANDTAKLDAMKPAMDAQHAQMKQIRDAEEAKIAKILTPEQNAQWQQLKAERAEHRRDRQ